MTYRYATSATEPITAHATHLFEEWHAYVCDITDAPDYVDGNSSGLCCHTCQAIIVDVPNETVAADTMPTITFVRVDRIDFEQSFELARRVSATVKGATSEFAHVRGTSYFLSAWDGRRIGQAGYAIRPTGELVMVFSRVRGNGDAIMGDAIRNGATHLDCFDGYLTTFYARHGFDRVTSLPNWTDGAPDVVYMARPGFALRALARAEEDIRPSGGFTAEEIAEYN